MPKVVPVFHAHPKSKPLRLLGDLQEHWTQLGMCFVSFPGANYSGNWMVGRPTTKIGYASYVPVSHSVCLERKGVREGKVQKKNETSTLQEQITFNEVRKGSSQISELLH